MGPLKHLSKEALEAAAEPDDLSEWVDMQFLLWDAQRRAGISDAEITAAMEDKLKINMERQWPEPKDGEPRLHIKEPGNYPATPDGWISCSERMPDKLIPVMVMYEDGEMWSAMWNGNRWDDGTEYPDPHSVTHWREMPAAPKQEVNRG
ncbi:dATP/dGTP pyrophosphohydrolase domain-containing protein [Escherichia coli]|uniref:dATP/dGTP pyrophosphohydrolase domain-containing protein n=1 Tax=Escherichia coli TaxID=562 RepID=UPI0037DD3C8B